MKINVTVCELPDHHDEFASVWSHLVKHIAAQGCDLLLLNEFPFDSWFAQVPEFHQEQWDRLAARNRDGIAGLGELGCSVLGTAPVTNDGRRYNQAFISAVHRSLRIVHFIRWRIP